MTRDSRKAPCGTLTNVKKQAKWALNYEAQAVLCIRIRIQCGPWIRIRICNPDSDPGGQKVLFRGLKACPVAWTSLRMPRD
jgi:hypothetical protein